MAERSNEAEKMEKWMKATSEIEKRGIKCVCRRDFMINERCPPSEYMYGFASSDGVSRKITTYISKVKQFKRINKRKNVAPGFTAVFTAQILNGKKYNKNRLPNKAEVQKVFDKNTRGIHPYVFSALHYGYGIPFDVCKELKKETAQRLLNSMNEYHPKFQLSCMQSVPSKEQQAAEDYLVQLFEAINLCALHGKKSHNKHKSMLISGILNHIFLEN
ncbi:hypothetical protein SELMODRAFT_410943 [Selaginella moellendorffii]|uniref:Uncharacterized protein n=1 Tax=Selaginella moellendorffii TaxID=88036 RepID=D8RGD1_SELML|nr:hypothetical protein SELMODRAFT_410943 [Selaginella moellendorffii]